FKEGLTSTIDWYKQNEAWWRPQKEATENKYKELGR
ncbi:MAG TPA: dTDP-glucose 4,6-dehydratase, partial [Candidatus Binatia bacterium]|nr:dTDP-glucose 4,6-dehydratase [Candidatus Binatia bacterium]